MLLSTLTVIEQISYVRANSRNIRRIKNPCKEAQLIAVKKNPLLIKYIEKPCKEVIELFKNA